MKPSREAVRRLLILLGALLVFLLLLRYPPRQSPESLRWPPPADR